MPYRFRILRLISLLALVTACSDKVDRLSGFRQAAGVVGDRTAPTSATDQLAATMAVARVRPIAAEGTPVAAFYAAQKLIRTGQMRIEVADVQATIRVVDSLARARGGIVADTRVSLDAQDRRQALLVIHVPSDRFVETVAVLKPLGDVREEVVNTQDVTRDYADLETRLAVKEQTVTRLRALLDNRTAKLSDVLEVERELSRAITELEQMKGERRYYDQQIALSTLTLTLVDRAGSRAVQFTGPIAQAFHQALEVLGRSIAGLIYLVTFLLPWVALAALGWWLVMRQRARPRGSRTESPPPAQA
jgi:uncharacterized protein DUF4349